MADSTTTIHEDAGVMDHVRLAMGHPSPKRAPKTKIQDSKIGRLIFRTRRKPVPSPGEEDLIQSLKVMSSEAQPVVLASDANKTSCIQESLWKDHLTQDHDVNSNFEDLKLAVKEFNSTATQQKRILIQNQGCEIEELNREAAELQRNLYPEKERKGLRDAMETGLQQFCKTTLHYAAIMDTLAQHHPEWVSLAWGTIKLFLMIPIEYQKMKEGIIAGLGKIGGRLELVSLLLRFYPTERMADAASTIYASIAEFLGFSVRHLSSNWIVKGFKTVVAPFDTRVSGILRNIDDAYAILKGEAEVQTMIDGFYRDLAMKEDQTRSKTDDEAIKRNQVKTIGLLEKLCLEASSNRQRQNQAIRGSKAIDQTLLTPPRLEICAEFFPDLLPLQGNLQRAQHRMQLLPVSQHHEGVDILRRPALRTWLTSLDSGILWIDGYQIPNRPSWTTDFALKTIHAASENGSDTLFYFGSLYHETTTTTSSSPQHPPPRALVQSLLFHMLQRFPAVTSLGDPDLFNTEIFLAAKSDLDVSWRIFVECLRLLPSPVVYIVVEGIDHIRASSEFETLLRNFETLSSARLQEKSIKVVFTSVRPDAGFHHLFPSPDRLEVEADGNVLIRVPQAAARSRKGRSRPQRKNFSGLRSTVAPSGQPSNNHDDDFAPSESDGSQSGYDDGSSSDSDFDIYSTGTRERPVKDTAEAVSSSRLKPPAPREGPSSQRLASFSTGNVASGPAEDGGDDSDSSFDIFEPEAASKLAEMVSTDPEFSDFAPSDESE